MVARICILVAFLPLAFAVGCSKATDSPAATGSDGSSVTDGIVGMGGISGMGGMDALAATGGVDGSDVPIATGGSSAGGSAGTGGNSDLPMAAVDAQQPIDMQAFVDTLPLGCPPAVANESGMGKPCTLTGTECTGSLQCSCKSWFGYSMPASMPCYCTSVTFGSTCSSCGTNATCCTYSVPVSSTTITISECAPSVCAPNNQCPSITQTANQTDGGTGGASSTSGSGGAGGANPFVGGAGGNGGASSLSSSGGTGGAGSCDPFSNLGCSSDQKCIALQSGNALGLGCGSKGSQSEGDTCTPVMTGGAQTGDDCGDQLACFKLNTASAYTCHRICPTAGKANACPGSETCSLVVSGLNGLAFCQPTTSCQPLEQTGCPSDQACYYGTKGAICAGIGPAQPGETCVNANDCAKGSTCLTVGSTGTCSSFCSTADGGTPGCSNGEHGRERSARS